MKERQQVASSLAKHTVRSQAEVKANLDKERRMGFLLLNTVVAFVSFNTYITYGCCSESIITASLF